MFVIIICGPTITCAYAMSRCAAFEFITRTEKGNLTEYGPHHTCVWFCSASLDTLPPFEMNATKKTNVSLRPDLRGLLGWPREGASALQESYIGVRQAGATSWSYCYNARGGYVYGGSFSSPYAAAKAYDAFLWANNLHYFAGSNKLVPLNFPSDVHTVPGARTSGCIV